VFFEDFASLFIKKDKTPNDRYKISPRRDWSSIGWIVSEQFSWRWIFIGMLPLVAIVILLPYKFLINVSETANLNSMLLES